MFKLRIYIPLYLLCIIYPFTPSWWIGHRPGMPVIVNHRHKTLSKSAATCFRIRDVNRFKPIDRPCVFAVWQKPFHYTEEIIDELFLENPGFKSIFIVMLYAAVKKHKLEVTAKYIFDIFVFRMTDAFFHIIYFLSFQLMIIKLIKVNKFPTWWW